MKPKNYQHLTRLFSTFLAFVTSSRTKTVVLHNSSKERFLTLVPASISFIRFNVNRKLARLCDQKKYIAISRIDCHLFLPFLTSCSNVYQKIKIYRNSQMIIESSLTSPRQQLSVFVARKWNRESGRVSGSEVLAVVNALIPTTKRRMVIVRKSNGTSALAVSVRSPANSLASLATD